MRRRDWLKLGGVAGVGAAMGLHPPGALAARVGAGDVPGRGRAIRNVIFLAYDGTGYEDLATADFFAREVAGRSLALRELLARGQAGVMIPSSLTSWVTDSSAASSAWATGRKTVNGAVNLYPDGSPLTPILELARDRGMATGLVTSARITHATPASWVARVPDRNMEDLIAEQYLEAGVDVLLGGGRGHFDPAVRFDRRDLLGEFRGRGYEVLTTADELERSTGSRLLGVFTPGTQHLPYEVDRRFQGHPAPSLATLTGAALTRLEGAAGGFVLQVEAGRIDHANHNNDPAGLLWDWMAADETLALLMAWVDAREDTLLIFACDHDTGGGVMYGWGTGYRNSDPSIRTLAGARASHEWLLREVLPRRPDSATVRAAVTELLGIPVGEAQAEELSALLSGGLPEGVRWGHRNAHAGDRQIQMAQLLSISPDNVPDRAGISFATGNHTAGFVPVALYGGGVGQGSLGLIDNTELYAVMTGALGIEHENPLMTEAEARAIIGG